MSESTDVILEGMGLAGTPIPDTIPYTIKDLVSLGSPVLNMAASGRPGGGVCKGTIVLLVGDSNAGKTWIGNTIFAEANLNPNFDGYRFANDDVERGALMDKAKYWGVNTAARIEDIRSNDIDEFYMNVSKFMRTGPTIYLLDSMDGLQANEDRTKAEARRKWIAAGKKGKEPSGSYGQEKAKKNSQFLREAIELVEKTKSILIIVCQSRDLVDSFSFETKTRAGGRALRFYSTLEIWLSVAGQIRQTVLGKDRKIGVKCRFEVKRSRMTGRPCEVIQPIYWSHGLDAIGAAVDYLVDEGVWKSGGEDGKGVITPDIPGLPTKQRETLVRAIEEGGYERDVYNRMVDRWRQVEAACRVKRKNRYESN